MELGVPFEEREQLEGAESTGDTTSAGASNVAPEAWLRHVLTHITDHPVNRVDDFLPWNCKLPAAL